MADMNFDSTEVEPIGEFKPIPVGEYMAVISASDRKQSKPQPGKSQGEYLQLVFDIINNEEYEGRKVFERLNIINDNETAVKIAQQKLSAICRILGITKLSNTEQLHEKPMVIVVGIRPAAGNYGESNEIKGYKRQDGATIKDILNEGGFTGASAGGAAPATSGAKPAEKKLKPWEKKK